MRLHERAVRAGAEVDRVLVASGLLASAAPRVRAMLDGLRAAGTRVVEAPDALLDELTEGRGTGAIAGLVLLPPAFSLDALLASAQAEPALFVVGVEMDDPGNVGAVIRTALASRATAFVSVGGTDPFHPKAVRTSMGALFKLPLARFASIDGLLQSLARASVRTVGAVSAGGEPLPQARFGREHHAVLLGREAFGLSADLAARLDLRVTVPMSEEVDSYSVNAAAAIVLYEIRRARFCTRPVNRGSAGDT